MVTPEIALLDRFNQAFNRHDVDAMMAAMTPDCVYENTYSAPDGTRYVGQDAVRRFWDEFFRASPYAYIECEEIIASGNRAAQLWTYYWTDKQHGNGHVRGVDVFHFRDGLIAAKLSYVKG